jgi:hypothetical protein
MASPESDARPGADHFSANKMPSSSKSDSFRKWIPRFLNALLWGVFCAMAGTGLLLAWRLPPGSQGGRGLAAWGLSRHEWGTWHTWLSYAFLFLILIHIGLHWRWFWQVAARKKIWPLLLGFLAGLALLFGLVLQPVSGQEPAHRKKTHAPQGEHHASD